MLKQNLTKIRQVGTDFFHADRQTDRQTDVTKLIVAFHNFARALKTPTSDSNSNVFSAKGFFEMFIREETGPGVCRKILRYAEYAIYD